MMCGCLRPNELVLPVIRHLAVQIDVLKFVWPEERKTALSPLSKRHPPPKYSIRNFPLDTTRASSAAPCGSKGNCAVPRGERSAPQIVAVRPLPAITRVKLPCCGTEPVHLTDTLCTV